MDSVEGGCLDLGYSQSQHRCVIHATSRCPFSSEKEVDRSIGNLIKIIGHQRQEAIQIQIISSLRQIRDNRMCNATIVK